ncbi:MAG: hypothetical protein IPK68_05625 [Bdellovibrionales bacterium]|nr:hypothetical protein [Bdellovibrionales bacterium]
MSNAVNSFLGQNAFSEIEKSETIKQIVLSISQKADAVNLEQLSEEIFVLAQDIFKALNEIYGRDIHLVKRNYKNIYLDLAQVLLGMICMLICLVKCLHHHSKA